MEKTIEQQRLEFLEDMISYYSEDITKRARDIHTNKDGEDKLRSYYLTEDGRMCAIGRILGKEIILKNKIIDEEYLAVKSVKVFPLLPVHIQNLGLEFLFNVQMLHDTDDYWNNNGLSDFGEWQVENTKFYYCKVI